MRRLTTFQRIQQTKGIPATSTRDWCRRGLLPYVQVEGSRRMWIYEDDVDRLIARSTFGRNPEAAA